MKVLKSILKGLLRKHGFETRWLPRSLIQDPYAVLQPCYEFLAPWVSSKQAEVVLVQVGANDGVMEDPVRESLLKFKWRAVLLEPQPDAFDRLVANYAGVPGVTLLRVAVAPENGTRKLYRVKYDPSHPPCISGIASFSREHLLKSSRSIPNLEDKIVADDVECATLETIQRRVGIDRIDVLQIDVEGFDAKVVGLVDLERTRPWIICYEWANLPRAENEGCVERLVRHGYKVVPVGPDMFAVRTA